MDLVNFTLSLTIRKGLPPCCDQLLQNLQTDVLVIDHLTHVKVMKQQNYHTFDWGNDDRSRISGTLVQASGCSSN
jgi:hypothetical protein